MSKENKELTSGQARRAKKKAGLNRVIAHIESTLGVNQDALNEDELIILADARLLKPGNRVARTGMKNVIADLFSVQEVGFSIDENQVWEDYKLGRNEMRSISVNLIKKAKPEDRMWISFDSETGIYTYMAKGETAPEGWTGYTPVVLEDIEIV